MGSASSKIPLSQVPRNDGYAGLNEDLWLTIFSHLDFPEVLHLAEVCHRWQEWVHKLTGDHLSMQTVPGVAIEAITRSRRAPNAQYIAKRAGTLEDLEMDIKLEDEVASQMLLEEISNCTRLQRLCLSSPGLPPVHEIVMALPRSLTALSLSKVEEADIFEIFRQRGLKDLKVLLDIDDSDFSRPRTEQLADVENLTLRMDGSVTKLWSPPIAFDELEHLRQLSLHVHPGCCCLLDGNSFIEAALRARNLHSLSILGLRDSEYRSVNWNLLAGLNYLQTLHVDIDVRRGRPVPSNLLVLPQLKILGLKLDRPEIAGIISGRDLVRSQVTALHLSLKWNTHCSFQNQQIFSQERLTSASAYHDRLYQKPFIMTFSILVFPAYPKPPGLSPILACCGQNIAEELTLERLYGPQDNHNLPTDYQTAVLRGQESHTRIYTTQCYSNAPGSMDLKVQQGRVQATTRQFPYPCHLNAEANWHVE